MKKRNLKTEKLSLKKIKVSKLENLNTIKGGGTVSMGDCGGSRGLICIDVK